MDRDMITHAIMGMQLAITVLQQKIAELEGQLRGSAPKHSGRSRMSPEARKRIGAAQRKRWTAFRKEKRDGKSVQASH